MGLRGGIFSKKILLVHDRRVGGDFFPSRSIRSKKPWEAGLYKMLIRTVRGGFFQKIFLATGPVRGRGRMIAPPPGRSIFTEVRTRNLVDRA